MKTILVFFTFLILASAQIFSQWISRYNGPGNASDEAFAVTADVSGNIYVTGRSMGSGSNLDYATIKYNSAGQQQWAARYNGPANFIDIANAIAVDASGNVYVTGLSTGTLSLSDYATIKYNSSGQELWVARYNGPSNGTDEAFSIAVDGAGNVYVTGQSLSSTNYDYATVKYNSSGIQQWASRYNGPVSGVDNADVVRVDISGNVYVTGTSAGSGSGLDYLTIKYNSSGGEVWIGRYNGTGNGDDLPDDMELDGAGNVHVTGGSVGSGSSNDMTTLKYTNAGALSWAARYNGTANENDIAFALKVSPSGNVYITGSSMGQGSATDYATVKYNSSGAQIWAMRFNGSNNTSDEATSLTLDGAEGVFVTGMSASSGINYDYATLKYNTNGVQQWLRTYNGPGNGVDGAFSITADYSGSVTVTGNSQGSGSGSDYATIRYDQFTGLQQISSNVPGEYRLYANYPNPFNPATKIRFDLPSASESKVTVFDLTGQLVEVLVDSKLSAGTYEVDFNASGLSSGVYFYKIETSGFSDTKKMMLVK
jgi:hypothetical protein